VCCPEAAHELPPSGLPVAVALGGFAGVPDGVAVRVALLWVGGHWAIVLAVSDAVVVVVGVFRGVLAAVLIEVLRPVLLVPARLACGTNVVAIE
jgi:hypothetical protein